MSLSTVQKVSRSGNSLMIIIPEKVSKILNIKYLDYIKIDWGEVIKLSDKQLEKENKEDKEEDSLPILN